ncbi:MAG: NAD(P)/FAD-dependent oxidoreductase [Pirellulales bacterium]
MELVLLVVIPSLMDPATSYDLIVVGAGAAGLVAAATAAERGVRTLLLEKNRKPGVKILMSGGTRCNITQATDNRGIVEAFGPPGRFLHSALAAHGVDDTIRLFEREGVATKTEPTGKIFPVSDKATDVLDALLRRLRRSECELALDEGVLDVEREGEGFQLRTSRRTLHAAKLLVTTGGQSYPGCGTIGEGYRWAANFGHTIVPPRPALVPITTNAAWVASLKGVTIPDVALSVVEASDDGVAKQRPLATRRGSFLFTHFGLSGPVVLDVSRAVSGHPRPNTLALVCDFLPNMKPDVLAQQLREQATSAGKKQLVSLLSEVLPKRLLETLLSAGGISPERRAAEVSGRDWERVVEALKRAAIPISGTRGFKHAEVTAGGVALDEVDSSTMQSKRAPNLYLAGEVLDLDGPIGGYNFQAAWSTGFLAGQSV